MLALTGNRYVYVIGLISLRQTSTHDLRDRADYLAFPRPNSEVAVDVGSAVIAVKKL
jgi:hypothetical protein